MSALYTYILHGWVEISSAWKEGARGASIAGSPSTRLGEEFFIDGADVNNEMKIAQCYEATLADKSSMLATGIRIRDTRVFSSWINVTSFVCQGKTFFLPVCTLSRSRWWIYIIPFCLECSFR